MAEFTGYKKDEIKKIVNNLLKSKYLYIEKIPHKSAEKYYYFHTEKVNPDILNDDIRYKIDFDEDYGKAHVALKKFQKDPKATTMKLKLNKKLHKSLKG